ncbi:MAG: hypothetical protein HZA53_14920 [Planctomycetes bacterium]|nr:hypothetical protein [Planctomycetota bacterium]
MSRKREPVKSVRSKGSVRKGRAGAPAADPALPDLASHRWNVGAVAWSPEGHIVILDPELRAKLAGLGRRKQKEIVIGLPPKSGARVGPLKDRVGYQPYPEGNPPQKLRWVGPLELCVCDGKLLRLVKTFAGQLQYSARSRVGGGR